ncbi:hypothetical protein D9V32_01815 [Mycetocola tolaasinivorans]|uniref:Uncharacterized protein n=1 Tax=Mycetocola tolaasinivorans TaxID=76635 RepID=A0A3L7ACY5_9MICO|nr:hypothetical protein D9V32_01815 [Mycetocola tolaasinivorans]
MLSRSGLNYPLFLLVGVLAILTFRAGTMAMSDVANDRKWGVLALAMLQGTSVRAFLGSTVVFGVLLYAAQAILVLGARCAAVWPADRRPGASCAGVGVDRRR